MPPRKNRAKKAMEYETNYSGIPLDYGERLKYLYDELNISPAKASEILQKRDMMMSSLKYQDINVILYEEPEGSPRPRFRIVNRKNLSNMAISNPNFVHVYSITGAEDNLYMKRLVTQDDFIGLDSLLCTPCMIEFNAYMKTPSSFSKTDIFLSEIGLIRPIAKPDWDNIGKKYSDMFNSNIWLDDIMVVDGTVRKFYSILPRVEIRIRYLNMIYNKYQYNNIINRKDYDESTNLKYFNEGDL